MTATIPDQATTGADEIQIVRTPPSMADAQLVVQLNMMGAMTGAFRGMDLLETFDKPPTLAQLKKRHPRGSQEFQHVTAFIDLGETIGTFVRQDILNETLVNDLYAIGYGWSMVEKIAKGIRRETGEPRMYENVEWLAKRATAPTH
jgi:hypothetical protein